METKTYYTFVLLRLLSLYLFLQTVSVIPRFIDIISFPQSFRILDSYIILLLLSIVLWVVSKPLADFMSKGSSADISHEDTVDSFSLEHICISLMGLYTVIVAIPGILSLIIYECFPSPEEELLHILYSKPNWYSLLLKDIVRILLGLVLIVFSSKIARLCRNIRLSVDKKPV